MYVTTHVQLTHATCKYEIDCIAHVLAHIAYDYKIAYTYVHKCEHCDLTPQQCSIWFDNSCALQLSDNVGDALDYRLRSERKLIIRQYMQAGRRMFLHDNQLNFILKCS